MNTLSAITVLPSNVKEAQDFVRQAKSEILTYKGNKKSLGYNLLIALICLEQIYNDPEIKEILSMP